MDVTIQVPVKWEEFYAAHSNELIFQGYSSLQEFIRKIAKQRIRELFVAYDTDLFKSQHEGDYGVD